MSREVHVRFCEGRAVRSRPATHLVVLVHGTEDDAAQLKGEMAHLLAERLKMTLSVEKTHLTRIDADFDFLGFHIRRKHREGRGGVVLTYPSKDSLAVVKHKIKRLTARGTTSLSLSDVLSAVNPVLRGWAAYCRYGVSKRTFAYPGWYARGDGLLDPPETSNRCDAATTGPIASGRTVSFSATR